MKVVFLFFYALHYNLIIFKYALVPADGEIVTASVDSILKLILSPAANELIELPTKSLSLLVVVSFTIVVLPIGVVFWLISTVTLALVLGEPEKK